MSEFMARLMKFGLGYSQLAKIDLYKLIISILY